MQDIQLLPIQLKDTNDVIGIMKTLSDYFSPETIEFAEEKIPNLQGFVAIKEEKIVGFITFEVVDSSHSKIYWVAILPECQHQGIGSILMNQAENSLRKQGIKKIELLTLDEHPDYPGYRLTREFHKKHGFEITSFEMQGDVKILTMEKTI